MVRRFSNLSSKRLLLGVFCVVMGAISAQAQVSDAARIPTQGGSPFVVAPRLTLPSSATSVSSGDLRGRGRADLVLTQKNSSNVTVLLGDGKGGFASRADYAAGAVLGHVVLADVMGTGHLDAVGVDAAAGRIVVLPGNGDGSFGKPVSFGGVSAPIALVTGNFGGKGGVDVAVANGSSVAVLLNQGGGRLSAPVLFLLDRTPAAIAAGKLDGSGLDGLVVANVDGTVGVFPGAGSGHFRTGTPVAAGSEALTSVTLADLAHSGHADLVVTHGASGRISIFQGDGNGGFGQGTSYTVGNGPASLLAVDLKGSGNVDLVTINRAANTFSVLEGNGDGTFKSAVDYVAGNRPFAAVAGSFSGKAGLAIVSEAEASISLPTPKGDGSFAAARSYGAAGLERKAVAAGDLDGDGRADLVVSNFCGADASCKGKGTVSVFLANADNSYRLGSSYEVGSGPVSVALAPIGAGGKLAILAANRNDRTLTVLPGNGDGTFGSAMHISLGGNPGAIYTEALGGGRQLVAVATDCGKTLCAQTGNVEVLVGRGDGTLSSVSSYAVGYSPVAIAGADLRGSGHIDLVVANACGQDAACKGIGTATILAGDGTGHFTPKGAVGLGSYPAAIALAKLNGSRYDLVVAQRGSGTVSVLAGDGKGSFTAGASYKAGTEPAALAVGNFLGHGATDIAVANFGSSSVTLLAGNGDGTLKQASSIAVGAGPESLAVLSVSKNGPASLVTANGNSGSNPMGADISVLLRPMVKVDLTGLTLTVVPAGTSNVDDAVTLTATAVGPAATPTGNVTFAIDNGGGSTTAISDCGAAGGVALDGTGVANCTTQQLPAGSLNLVAVYAGDVNYNGKTSPDSAQTVSAAVTSTTVASTTSSVVDQTATLNATVAPSPLPAIVADGYQMTGSVAFSADGSLITGCTAVAVTFHSATAVSSATCNVNSLTAGDHTITAAYTGDANFQASSDAVGKTQTVTKAATAAVLVSSSSSTVAAQSVTLTATVSPAVGTLIVPIGGNVEFDDGGASIGTGAVDSGTGIATLTTSTLSVGTHTLKAKYLGDATNYSASSASGPVSQAVSKAATTATVNSISPAAPVVNDDVTITATVAATAPSGGGSVVAFAGNMKFTDGSSTIGGCSNVVVNTGTGVAICSVSSIKPGAHAYKATYQGDGSYTASPASAALNVTPSSGTTTTTLAANPTTTTVDNAVTLTATVSISPAPGTPLSAQAITGTVAFKNGAASVGCDSKSITYDAATATAAATCTLSALTAVNSPYGFVATYSGDGNYSGSVSSTTQVTINKASTATAIATSNANISVNGSVTFTATVSAPAGGTVALTGTVAFADNSTPIGACTAQAITWHAGSSTATATCATTALLGGNHTITGTYSGDGNYTTSNQFVAETVTPGSSTTTIHSSSGGNKSVVNESVTLTSQVIPFSSSVPLTGTLTFTDGGAPVAGCTVSFNKATGAGSCTTNSLPLGGHTITATYAGDPSYNSSNAQVTQTVSQGSVTTALTSNLNPSSVNSSVTLTATVTPGITGGVALSGNVTFSNGGTTLCSSVPVAASTGQATCVTSTLPLGNDQLSAAYGADANFAETAPGTLTQVVRSAATTTALSASPNPSVVNNTVVFTATVSAPPGGQPLTGKVAFTADGNPIAGCTAVTPSLAGVAICSDSALTASAGGHAIKATYGNDNNFGSSFGSVSQVVNKANTSTALTSTVSPSTVSQSVTFTATVTPVPSGTVALASTVSFTDSVTGTFIPSCSAVAVDGNGVATCTTAALTVGSHTVTAAYGADSNFNTSQNTFVQTVNAASASISVTSTSASATVNANPAVMFTAVFVVPVGLPQPTGKVAFTDNGSAIAGCTVVTPVLPAGTATNWQAQCADPALTSAALTHTILASYSGDVNFSVGSGSVVQQVTPASAGIAVASSLNPSVSFVNNASNFQDSVTFTAMVTPVQTGSIGLAGAVTFTNNGAVLCANVPVTVAAGKGTATCTSTTLPAGTNTIVASYGGDANFASAIPATLSQAVEDFSLTVAPVPTNSVGVLLTQGYTNSNDPFTPAGLAVTGNSTAGYSGSPTMTCTSVPSAGAPACTFAQSGLPIANGQTQQSIAVALNAAGATAGSYTFTITAVDSVTSLTRTYSFPVTVRAVSTPLVVTSGSTSGNVGNVTFQLPGGVTLSNFTCPYISGTGITGNTTKPGKVGVACSIGTPSISGTTVTVPVTVTTNNTFTSGFAGRNRWWLALYGVLMIGLLGTLRRKVARVALFRVLMLLAIGIGILQTAGCGGSFKLSTPIATGGTTPPGQYFLLIQGTGSDGNTYSAVLELDVTL